MMPTQDKSRRESRGRWNKGPKTWQNLTKHRSKRRKFNEEAKNRPCLLDRPCTPNSQANIAECDLIGSCDAATNPRFS